MNNFASRAIQAVIVCMGVLPCAALSQQNGCENILRQGVYDYFRDSQDGHSAAQIRSEISRAMSRLDRDERSGSVGASYGMFGGSVSASAAQLRAMSDASSSDFAQSNSQSTLVTKASTILNAGVVDAWKACSTQNQAGLQVTFDVPDDFLAPVHFKIRYVATPGTPQDITVRGVHVFPSDAFDCEWTADRPGGRSIASVKEFTETNGNEISMSCVRKISTQPIDVAGRRLHAAPARISIQTDKGTATRPFSGIPVTPSGPSTSELLMAAFPVGTIFQWNGNHDVPAGWAICDGKNGTPDLVNRFPRGTIDKDAVGLRGGDENHTHKWNGRTPEGQRKGSDYQWGNSGWRNGPNPTVGGQSVEGVTEKGSSVPPYTYLIFIMKIV